MNRRRLIGEYMGVVKNLTKSVLPKFDLKEKKNFNMGVGQHTTPADPGLPKPPDNTAVTQVSPHIIWVTQCIKLTQP